MGKDTETVFAHFLSGQTGVPVDIINVVKGDSDLIVQGGGTGGLRSATARENATLATVQVMVEAFRVFLSEKFETDLEHVTFDHETYRIIGSNFSPDILECVKNGPIRRAK